MQIDIIVRRRLTELLEKGDKILSAATSSEFRGRSVRHVSKADAVGYCTSAANLLQRAFGESSIHFKAFQSHAAAFSGYESEFQNLQAILAAAKEDYEGGYLFSVRGIVKAEVLDDAFEQATVLLASEYKDPACVLIGVSLEVALKELADRHAIPHAKLDKMNADLYKCDVYNITKQQQITAWAALRNKAAHGNWSAYTKEDVDDMLRGVKRFIADYL